MKCILTDIIKFIEEGLASSMNTELWRRYHLKPFKCIAGNIPFFIFTVGRMMMAQEQLHRVVKWSTYIQNS